MWELVLFGFLGGITVDILNLLEIKNLTKKERPNFKNFIYWLPYIFNPILSVILVFVVESSDKQLKVLSAFETGLGAPLILKSLVSALPKQGVPQLGDGA
jgi:hypothetical protein